MVSSFTWKKRLTFLKPKFQKAVLQIFYLALLCEQSPLLRAFRPITCNVIYVEYDDER